MSMQSGHNKEIEYIPIREIKRPIQPQLDLQKVQAMLSTLKGTPMASPTCTLEQATALRGELPPVDVFRLKKTVVVDPERNVSQEKTFYFVFASCHRMATYDLLQQETPDKDVLVKCKIYPAIESQLRLYMGSSLDHWLS